MTAKTRLSLVGFVILASAAYAVLVDRDPELARTIMVGYIGLVLTIFVASELWRRP